MATENVETLINNCKEYAKATKGVGVLKVANGKNHYTKIAKMVGTHPTKVSSLLKKAEKLGLAKKIKPGIYKKVAGILGYMPTPTKTKSERSKTVSDLTQKIEKSKKTKSNYQSSSGLTIPNKIEVNLEKMAGAYRALYAVENTLRELIRKVLNREDDWWKNRVPNGVQAQVEEAMNKHPYHAAKRKDELEYTHLGQLKEIIINKKNWADFSTHLNTTDKSDFTATIDKAIPSRNAIGHCIPLMPKDLKIVDVRFVDILDLIK